MAGEALGDHLLEHGSDIMKVGVDHFLILLLQNCLSITVEEVELVLPISGGIDLVLVENTRVLLGHPGGHVILSCFFDGRPHGADGCGPLQKVDLLIEGLGKTIGGAN